MTVITVLLITVILLWAGLEGFLEYAFRSPDTANKQDRWSSKIFNGIVACSVAGWFAAMISAATDDLHQKPHIALYLPRVALTLLTLGLLLRFYAVATLKKHFTVDLAIQHEHQLIQHGPYRLLRHPSYTGALLCFSGLALSAGFWGTTLDHSDTRVHCIRMENTERRRHFAARFWCALHTILPEYVSPDSMDRMILLFSFYF